MTEPALAAVVVGTGFGLRVHVPALRAAGFNVVAAVGREPERTARRAARLGVAGATTLAEGLERCGRRPVLVSIATPPDTHAPLVLEALAAGAHVLCEKPFALDRVQAQAMADRAAAAGVVAAVGHEFRWAEDRATLARALAEGRIGRPRLATLVSAVALVADPASTMPSWWFTTERGGGWLGASGSHAVDQIRSWLGEFASLSATMGLLSDRDASVEDTFTVRFCLAGGLSGVLQQTAAAWGPMANVTRVVGDAGTLWLDGTGVWLADRSGTCRLEPPDDLRSASPSPSSDPRERFTHLELGPYVRLFCWLGDAIGGERPWPPKVSSGPTGGRVEPAPATFEDGVRCMEVLDAIRRSAAGGGELIRL